MRHANARQVILAGVLLFAVRRSVAPRVGTRHACQRNVARIVRSRVDPRVRFT